MILKINKSKIDHSFGYCGNSFTKIIIKFSVLFDINIKNEPLLSKMLLQHMVDTIPLNTKVTLIIIIKSIL